jgi:hypothetical protein
LHILNGCLEPIAMAVDGVESSGEDVRFAGIDLDSGQRLSVSITRDAHDGPSPALAPTLLLLLTVQTCDVEPGLADQAAT